MSGDLSLEFLTPNVIVDLHSLSHASICMYVCKMCMENVKYKCVFMIFLEIINENLFMFLSIEKEFVFGIFRG